MPRECPPVFRSARAVAGTGSTMRRSVPQPSAIAPVRCHVRCCALRAKAQCGVHVDLSGLTQRHNHGRLIRSLDDAAGVPALPASWGWRQPVRGLAASRCGWLRSFERREESRDRRKSDDVCCPAWLGRLDSVPSAAPKNCPDRTAVHDRPRPVNLSPARQPVQQGEVDQLPDARLLPVTYPHSAPQVCLRVIAAAFFPLCFARKLQRFEKL
jgi:hypothetical protein